MKAPGTIFLSLKKDFWNKEKKNESLSGFQINDITQQNYKTFSVVKYTYSNKLDRLSHSDKLL